MRTLDGDAFGDGDEIDEGTNPNYNPNTDSDGDGVSDSLELVMELIQIILMTTTQLVLG